MGFFSPTLSFSHLNGKSIERFFFVEVIFCAAQVQAVLFRHGKRTFSFASIGIYFSILKTRQYESLNQRENEIIQSFMIVNSFYDIFVQLHIHGRLTMNQPSTPCILCGLKSICNVVMLFQTHKSLLI